MPSFHSKGYPWIKYFLEHRLPAIARTKPRVFKAFQKHSNLTEKDAATVLKPRMLPRVVLRDMPGKYGNTPLGMAQIQIEKTFAKELEEALSHTRMPSGDYHAPTDLEVNGLLLLEATILHEMVHYFRLKTLESARINATSGAKGYGIEERQARRFEKDAYGYLPGVRNTMMSRHLPKTSVYMGEEEV
ncbi:zincin-like metallopeptidase toxin 3 of polymorphic toxin system [Litoreibacter meonggei]|uniref:Zincin-like metallopeptidase toxin 3 of polymorphic toxin system n=1 Tax=Litoreibacter meonggei TaxID=1049199 RepID=A0A497WR58_9RHOB|nr:hypothetical protein [Litoreibacter meonggei]RLJ59052.1 zincin-like metallopeptidase toxin 3 of polymorphic toxin system [Litoreibacter meonggei]